MGNVSADFRSDEDDAYIALRSLLVDQHAKCAEAVGSNDEAMELFKEVTGEDEFFANKFQAIEWLDDLSPDDASAALSKISALTKTGEDIDEDES